MEFIKPLSTFPQKCYLIVGEDKIEIVITPEDNRETIFQKLNEAIDQWNQTRKAEQ